MKNEILNKILSAPLSEWNKEVLILNGAQVILQQNAGAQSVWLTIDGVALYSPKIKALYYVLRDIDAKRIQTEEKSKLESIYNKIIVWKQPLPSLPRGNTNGSFRKS